MIDQHVFIRNEIKLTIGILVSNHIEYIRKGLESVKPLLESVPSELIVVDTVGEEKSDGSLAVAKEYTDRIYHFDWINDFSAARNVAIEHARGEWFLYFDDDEYFDDVTEIIDFFKTKECEKYNFARYYTGDYTDATHFEKHVAGRMIKRTAATRFTGVVHECFNDASAPIKQFEAFTHHFGYMFETKEKKEAKVRRNLTLLEEELKKNGANVRTCAQIVQELMLTDPEEAARRSLAYINKLREEDLKDSAGQWLLLANIRYMAGWAGLDIVVSLADGLKEQYGLNEMTRMVINRILIGVAYAQKRFKEVSVYTSEYIRLCDWIDKHDEERVEQTNFDLNVFMQGARLGEALSDAIVAETVLGDYKKAYKYFVRLDLSYCSDALNVRRAVEYALKELNDRKFSLDYYRRFYRDELIDNENLRKYLRNGGEA